MDVRSAASLIREAVPQASGLGGRTWADLGAGTGTFTLALASLLGPRGRVIAVDRDTEALGDLARTVERMPPAAEVITIHADFSEPFSLPRLDGLLLANALHFVQPEDQGPLLGQLVRHIRPDGRLIVVDYDGRGANAWVPYPVSSRRLHDLLRDIGLPAPRTAGQRQSRYGGTIYAAWSAVPGRSSKT